MIKVGIGQDSHRIQEPANGKTLVLGGLILSEKYALEGNSDSDVILHAITNAISSITGKPILGPVADKMCQAGIINSARYLDKALSDLNDKGYQLSHISISIECMRPKILPILSQMIEKLSSLTELSTDDIGITATTGEGLTDFGKGLGVQAFAIVTVQKMMNS